MSKLRLLVVDDKPAEFELLRQAILARLADRVEDVEFARHAREALERANTGRFHLILMDQEWERHADIRPTDLTDAEGHLPAEGDDPERWESRVEWRRQGFGAMRLLKSQSSLAAQVTIIFCTRVGDEKTARDFTAVGASHYFD